MQVREKVGSLKLRVRSNLARWEMRSCTPLWRERHFQVKMYKALQLRSTFASCDVEKVHAVVARGTFPSQNVQNTPGSEHLWKLQCRKSARPCGEGHFQVKMYTQQAHHVQGTSGSWEVEKVHAFVARSTSPSPKCKKLMGSEHFLTFRCGFAWVHARDSAPGQKWAKSEFF